MSEFYKTVDTSHIDKAMGFAAQKKVVDAQQRVASQMQKDAIEKQTAIKNDMQRKLEGDRLTRNPQGFAK